MATISGSAHSLLVIVLSSSLFPRIVGHSPASRAGHFLRCALAQIPGWCLRDRPPDQFYQRIPLAEGHFFTRPDSASQALKQRASAQLQ
jgi:hypothetical protein